MLDTSGTKTNLFFASEQKAIKESNNNSSGWNAGVTISNQMGFGVTAGGIW